MRDEDEAYAKWAVDYAERTSDHKARADLNTACTLCGEVLEVGNDWLCADCDAKAVVYLCRAVAHLNGELGRTRDLVKALPRNDLALAEHRRETNERIASEADSLRSRLAEVEAERDRLLTVSQQPLKDRDRVLGERDAARDEVKRLRSLPMLGDREVSDLKADNGVLTKSVANLRAEVEALRAERDAMRAEALSPGWVLNALAGMGFMNWDGRDAYDFMKERIEADRTTRQGRAGKEQPSGFVVWPANEPPRWNACNEPCDMWTGPCCCGATHTEGR